MHYFGRMPAVLFADDGSPAVAYGLTARSPPNRKRKFYDRGDRLYVGPLKEGSEREVKDAHLIFYNTMLTKGNVITVTNGQQTDGRTFDGDTGKINFEQNLAKLYTQKAEEIMRAWGYESDSMTTPRVSLARTPDQALFAMATEFNGESREGAILFSPSSGRPKGLPTYMDSPNGSVAWHIANSGEVERCLIELPLSGNNAQEIAENLFYLTNPSQIIAAAAGVFRNGLWEVRFRNRFDSETEFEAYTENTK